MKDGKVSGSEKIWVLFAAVDVLAFSSGEVADSRIVSELSPSCAETLAEIAPRMVEDILRIESSKLQPEVVDKLKSFDFDSRIAKVDTRK